MSVRLPKGFPLWNPQHSFYYAKLVYFTLTMFVSGGVFADFYDIFYAATFMTSLFL